MVGSAMSTMLQWLTALGVGAIVGGVITHVLTTLAREAEREYERTHDGYVRLLSSTRNLLEGSVTSRGIEDLIREIDRAWLYGSDDILRIMNEVTDRASRGSGDAAEDQRLLGALIVAMRQDLWRKRSFPFKLWPWRRTRLLPGDYRLIRPTSFG